MKNNPLAKRLSIIALFCGFGFLASAAFASPQIPKDLKLIGKASLSVLWWDIYDSALYNATGTYQTSATFDATNAPIMLSLTYQRKIKSEDLIKETKSQWERFKIPGNKTQRWLSQLNEMWPDVDENDNISFYIDASQQTHFYFNQSYAGTISDPEFGSAFINIWLAEKGPHPRVTKGLTGQLKKKKRSRRR